MDGKTLVIPNEIYQRAEYIARKSGRDATDLISELLGTVLPSLQAQLDDRPVKSLSNDEVIALAMSKMDPTLNERMNDLMWFQDERELSSMEAVELESLLEISRTGQDRKAEALVESMERGLKLPKLP